LLFSYVMLFVSVGYKRKSLLYYHKLEEVGPAEKFILYAKIRGLEL